MITGSKNSIYRANEKKIMIGNMCHDFKDDNRTAYNGNDDGDAHGNCDPGSVTNRVVLLVAVMMVIYNSHARNSNGSRNESSI